MFDHSTPLQVPSRVADRITEMQARRLASEVRAGSTRTHWLSGTVRTAVHSRFAILTRLRNVHLRSGPRLSSRPDRA